MRTSCRYPWLLLLALPLCSKVLGLEIVDGLIGYWPMDEADGNVAHDISGRGMDGTLVNYPANQGSWGQGQVGGSLHFQGGNGSGEYVVIPAFGKATSSYTISAWVWEDTWYSVGAIATDWAGYHSWLGTAASGNPKVQVTEGDSTISVINSHYDLLTLSAGSWHHLAVTLDANAHEVRFWHDGFEAVGDPRVPGNLVPSPFQSMTIGGHVGGSYSWQGKLDDIGIWNRVLSEQELRTIYENGLKGQPLAAIPEPTTIALLSLGMLVLCARVRTPR